MTRWLFQAFVVAAIIFAGNENAYSSPSDDVTASLEAAATAFSQQRWDEATKILAGAESQASEASNDKLLAKVVCFESAVIAAQGQSNKSIAGFRRALKLDPSVKLTKVMATPEVRDAFKKALLLERSAVPLLSSVSDEPAAAPAPSNAVATPQKALAAPLAAEPAPIVRAPATQNPPVAQKPEVAKAPAQLPPQVEAPTPVAEPATAPVVSNPLTRPSPSADSEEPDLPASLPRPLHCPNPDEAPPNHDAILRCVAQPEIQIAKVLLFYRLPGNESYETVTATKTPRGWYTAVVPAKAFAGKMVQYYFDARDGADKSVADNGRFESPNIMIVSKNAPPVTHNALAGVRMEGSASVSDDSEENPIARFFDNEREDTGRKFWISLAVGRGIGFHGTATLEWSKKEVSGGSHPASAVHLAPEIGFLVSPHFALALQLRNQLIVHTGMRDSMKGSPALGANAGLLRAIWFLPVGQFSNLQLSGIVGAGEGFRLVVPPNEVNNRPSSDTVKGGPVIGGVGLHTDIALSEMWALRLGVEALQGFGNSATVIDFAAGGVAWF
jgi:hypothetical protein